MRTEYFRDLSDNQLVDYLVELSGTDPKVLENKEFVDMLLPTLRGFYEAIAGYKCEPDATVSCPVYASVGDDDRLAPVDAVSGWARHTTAEFGMRVFDGRHFYFTDHLSDVAADIESRFSGSRPAAKARTVRMNGTAPAPNAVAVVGMAGRFPAPTPSPNTGTTCATARSPSPR